jgi:hypothetical protein
MPRRRGRSTASSRRSPLKRLRCAAEARPTSASIPRASTRSSTLSRCPLRPDAPANAVVRKRRRRAFDSPGQRPGRGRVRGRSRLHEPDRRTTGCACQTRPPAARAGAEEARAQPRRACAERVRRPANRRRSAAARGRPRWRKPPACRRRRRERARRRDREDDAQPSRRPGIRQLRLLVRLPHEREVRVGADLRVRRPPPPVGPHPGPQALLTAAYSLTSCEV